MSLFHLYLRWYVGRHFHGLRIAHGERFPRAVSGPLLIYLNHPSWWDPLTCILVSRSFLPAVDHYAPMDESALRRYKFFQKLGLFAVEPDTARGGVQFLRHSSLVLSTPDSVLWLTPQGRFVDVRQKSLLFKPGMGALLSRFPMTTVVPLAIEYTYWDERLPEILVNCGMPIKPNGDWEPVASKWNEITVDSLAEAQRELHELALTRDATKFETILEGSAGIGSMYNLWQRMRAGMKGEQYKAEHGSIQRP